MVIMSRIRRRSVRRGARNARGHCWVPKHYKRRRRGGRSTMIRAIFCGVLLLHVSVVALSDEQGTTEIQGDSIPLGIDIPLDERTIGTVENLRLVPDATDTNRGNAIITARFDHFLRDLDKHLTDSGDLTNSNWYSVYWVGKSRIISADYDLRLSSLVRGEVAFIKVPTRVRWKVFVNPAPLTDVVMTAQITDIDNFPDDLERLFKLRMREDMKIPIPVKCGPCDCAKFIEVSQPAFESISFSQTSEILTVAITFSLNAVLDLSELSCG